MLVYSFMGIANFQNSIENENDELEWFLQLVQWAEGITRSKYTELRHLIGSRGVQLPSLRCQTQRLQKMTEIKPQFIHCCYNNCIAYTGQYAEERNCPYCEEARYVENTSKPRKSFVHIPLIDRLKLQYRNPIRAKTLIEYRENLLQSAHVGELADFFSGKLFNEFHIHELGLFRDPHDIALHMSLDGVQLTNMGHHEVTPVIFVNLNLPPEERYQKKNILAGVVIPGLKKPRELDTFLRPLVDELLLLDKGVDAFDSYRMAPFQLKAWVMMVTGDGPALANAIGMKRPGNALRPCRTCEIKAEKSRNTYYVPHSRYNFSNPPLRKDLRDLIKLVEVANSDEHRKLTGITRSSILLELRSLHFPQSFPADIMHLILLNIAPTLYSLWKRTKLHTDDRTNPNFVPKTYHFDDHSLTDISTALVGARQMIPTYLCHTPRRIDKHYKGYKAAEWEAWLKLLSIPLLDQRLHDDYVDNFRLLSRIYCLSTQSSLQHSDIDTLDDLVVHFVRSYEELYYGYDPQRLSVCSVNVHYLLHFPSYIRDCGPSCYWWQFPMKRFCGILKPKARSKSRLDSSVANWLVITEHLNHVQLSRLRPAPSPASYPTLMDEYKAELSSQQHLRLVREYGEITKLYFYKRSKIREDLIIGSTKSQRRGDITRSNSRVCYSRTEHSQVEFGIVQYFLKTVNRFQEIRRLAWIKKLENIDIDHAKRICSYGSEGGHCWIEVGWVRSLIGLIQDGGVKFIITDVNLFDDEF
jgi:hypothetical protein